MIFSENSVIMRLLTGADEIDLISWGVIEPQSNYHGDFQDNPFRNHDYDRPRIIYMSKDLNEPKDLAFYSDRFGGWTTNSLRRDIEEQVGCSIFSLDIWLNRKKAEKAIELLYLANRSMTNNDKIVVTGIIRLVNRSNGFPYCYILYRIDSK